MLSVERQQAIIDLVDKNDSALVTDLVRRFNVSEMTIRRDLDQLERKGLLRRVHGGAVSNHGRSYEPPYMLRSTVHNEEKKRIGAAAAELIKTGDSILLDVGTTTLEIARSLHNHQNLTVITPSFHIATLLAEHPGIRLILTGGILRHSELSMVGNLAAQSIHEFYVDKLFLGAGGVDLQAGFSEFNQEDAQVKQVMLHQARDITAVVDSSKFGLVALAAIAPITAVNRIITDSSAQPQLVERMRDLGIEMILV